VRIAIYGRVSTPKQSVFPQLYKLKAYARGRPGWKVTAVYKDVYSGASDKRPGLDRLMADAMRKQFDAVLVWRFDRFARSVRQLVTAAETFQTLGIDFISAQEAIDTTTPYGKITFVLIAAVGEIERSLINDRTEKRRQTVYRSYKRKGKHWGRPRSVFDRAAALALRQADPRLWSWRKLGAKFGQSKDTMQRELTRYAAARPAENQKSSQSPRRRRVS
jgi:DNA invertase Pin-like site-specific DNA recombinase